MIFSSIPQPSATNFRQEESTMAEAPGAYSMGENEMNIDERYDFKREFRKQK